MSKKNKSNGLPAVGENEFNSRENKDAAEAYWRKLTTAADGIGFKDLKELAQWAQFTIGWKSFGRMVMTGECDR